MHGVSWIHTSCTHRWTQPGQCSNCKGDTDTGSERSDRYIDEPAVLCCVELCDRSTMRVRGDLRQLTHAVRNLFDNAARHAETRVVVSLDANGGGAILAVDDDGEGIPEGERHAIFERFVRLDESRGRSSGGAGLGLALVAEVARIHGGSVVAGESQLGGARLVLCLPRLSQIDG